MLIQAGADVNADGGGVSLMHLAAKRGDTDMLRLLLDAGADIHAHNSKKQTPLHQVVLSHNNYHFNNLFSPECDGWCSWTCAAKKLISLGAHVNAVDEEQNTPLHMAAQQGAKELLVLLLDAGADIHAHNSKKQTPLHQVVLSHNNYHFNNLFSPECDGWCSWTCAAKKLISLGAHVNAVDEEQNTPLHMAAQQGAKELLVLLLDAGADIHAQNSKKQTLLHHVVLGHNNAHSTSRFTPGCDDTCSWICVAGTLISLGAHVNTVDEEQNTPLHVAAQTEAKEMLVLLLLAGADRHACNCSQETPLDIVIKYGMSADIKEMLVDRASEHRPAIQVKTGDQGVKVIEMEMDDASRGNGTPSQDPEEGPASRRKYSIAFPPESN
ncbi:ankyrin repeat-containing domain protein [Morchella snyderi]|nr:ankyrin repeat-containing domain protein [Morchella snyderi]